MNHYTDRSLTIDDDGITITSYYWPGHRRQVPFSSITAVAEIPLGTFSGRFRVVGFEFRRPRLFFPWDTRRSSMSKALALDIGRRIRPIVSPEEHDRVLRLILDRISGGSNTTPTAATIGSNVMDPQPRRPQEDSS